MANKELHQVLMKTKIKELRADWLILVVDFLLKHFSVEEVLEQIKDGNEDGYLVLYRQLPDLVQRDLVSNYLGYAASIDDDFLFINSIFDD